MKKKYVIIAISVLVIALIVVSGQLFTVRHISVVFYNKTGVADETGVLAASGLNGRNNIFNIKESELKKNVANAYADNSIVVTDVVRSFPNEIIIYVKERLPIFKIKVYTPEGDDMYCSTDKDFQLGTVKKNEEITLQLIEVSGFGVYTTFDIKECILLRSLADKFISLNIDEEALPYLISKINFRDGNLDVTFRETGAIMSVSAEEIDSRLPELFQAYLNLSPTERYGAVL